MSSIPHEGTGSRSFEKVPELIDRAGRRVVAVHAAGPVMVADVRHLEDEVGRVVGVLKDVALGGDTPPLEEGALDSVDLLREIRTELLGEWDDRDGSDLLEVMRVFEVAQERLARHRENAAMSQALTPFSRRMLREVAHLMRSPLGSIVMLADMLLSTGDLRREQEHQVEIIHRAALSLTSASCDLLNLVGDDHRADRRVTFQVGSVMKTVFDIVHPVALARNRPLEWEAGIEGRREGPELSLLQALLSLALLAVLEGRGGSVELRALPEDNTRVRFEVLSHQAPGHKAGPLPDVFKVLRIEEDADSFTLSPEGLSVAGTQALLRRVGSELEVETHSPAGRSYSFTVALPPRSE